MHLILCKVFTSSAMIFVTCCLHKCILFQPLWLDLEMSFGSDYDLGTFCSCCRVLVISCWTLNMIITWDNYLRRPSTPALRANILCNNNSLTILYTLLHSCNLCLFIKVIQNSNKPTINQLNSCLLLYLSQFYIHPVKFMSNNFGIFPYYTILFHGSVFVFYLHFTIKRLKKDW